MAVVVAMPLAFGHFAGSEHGQRILPHFLRLRRADAHSVSPPQQRCPDIPAA